jgi:hypothetical protein
MSVMKKAPKSEAKNKASKAPAKKSGKFEKRGAVLPSPGPLYPGDDQRGHPWEDRPEPVKPDKDRDPPYTKTA